MFMLSAGVYTSTSPITNSASLSLDRTFVTDFYDNRHNICVLPLLDLGTGGIFVILRYSIEKIKYYILATSFHIQCAWQKSKLH
jgi:hypothetical protein